MQTYKNPILPGFYPDPSVCRVGRDYYLVTSSFSYFPGVPIFHSRDLVHFRQLGHCLSRPSQVPLGKGPTCAGIFAPTIRFHEGTFYVTTTNVTSGGNFIVTASAPEGPWSEPIFVAQPGIDPSLFFDDDGNVYYTTSHEGALQSRIDVRTGALLSEPKLVWTGTGGQYPEGPHLYKRQGYYYLLLSEGGTEYGHMITMARSRSPWGPFQPCARNPLLTHRSYKSPIQGTGHADLVDTPEGDWFAVALAFRPKGYPPAYHLGRETYLCPVKWPDEDFPLFGNGGHIELEHETSLRLEPLSELWPRDDFDRHELSHRYNYLRNPNEELYSTSERPGFLRLRGSADGLTDLASPAWIGQRQRHFQVKVTTCLEFEATTEREEAGLVVRMDERHHYELFVSRRNGVSSVILRRRIGSLVAEEAFRPLRSGMSRVVLSIDADDSKYVFSFGPTEGALEVLGEGETRYLSTEVAGGFTGVFFGLYATGNGTPCSKPADFDWFDYLPHGDRAS
jgi:alpha-N-arabinofuranosidase